jgi:hypothetical protein
MAIPPSSKPRCSSYLLSPARTLYEACRETGRDRDGAVCPVCGVKDLCDADRARAATPAAAPGVAQND